LIPGIATFGQLANAYQRMVEGTKLNRLFLKALLGQMLSAVVHDGDEIVHNTELSEHYWRLVTWMLQYYLCNCSSWRFIYSSFNRPSLPALIAAVDTFDATFEPNESLSRLAMLLIKNTPQPCAHFPLSMPSSATHLRFRDISSTKSHFCDFHSTFTSAFAIVRSEQSSPAIHAHGRTTCAPRFPEGSSADCCFRG
jgi:hypothetical protein